MVGDSVGQRGSTAAGIQGDIENLVPAQLILMPVAHALI